MRTLYFEINGQTLRKIDNFSGIIKGSLFIKIYGGMMNVRI